MSRQKVEFLNKDNQKLIGLLEIPNGPVHGTALFAHCFTCSKDIKAATIIAAKLSECGIMVLRFDFTGLGASEGEFANTNFSSNVDDLVAACEYLSHHHQAPDILIGHSLGGAAVLAAAKSIPSAKAVVTIGAPSTADHVKHHFKVHEQEIKEKGQATVQLAGRAFTIKKQLLDDLDSVNINQDIAALRKALLIFHAPLDETVSIDEAAAIYAQAKHPKSFITLDSADHLLSNMQDAEYVASCISAWVNRYLTTAQLPKPKVKTGEVLIESMEEYTHRVSTDDHQWFADEPQSNGGANTGPDPYEHLLAALGTCTAITLRYYADFKKIDMGKVSITLKHSKEHAQDCQDCKKEDARIDVLTREINIEGTYSAETLDKFNQIANKCPVHKTLLGEMRIETTVEAYQ